MNFLNGYYSHFTLYIYLLYRILTLIEIEIWISWSKSNCIIGEQISLQNGFHFENVWKDLTAIAVECQCVQCWSSNTCIGTLRSYERAVSHFVSVYTLVCMCSQHRWPRSRLTRYLDYLDSIPVTMSCSLG